MILLPARSLLIHCTKKTCGEDTLSYKAKDHPCYVMVCHVACLIVAGQRSLTKISLTVVMMLELHVSHVANGVALTNKLRSNQTNHSRVDYVHRIYFFHASVVDG